MKKIIVPVDFSKQAAYALDLAMQIAKKDKYEVTVLHVIEYPVGGIMDPVGVPVPPVYDKEFIDLLKEKAEERMENFLMGFDDTESLDVQVDIGNAYAGIAEKLLEEEYDLIIMGTKGASGLREFFIGSNTEKVVRTARCPVIAVRENVQIKNIHNIVFATAGTEVSEDLITHVKQLQSLFEAKLHIVRINTPNNFESDRLVLPLLEKMAQRFMLKDYSVNVYNDVYEDQGIMHFAEAIGADMIAMGTHGRKGFGHFISGSLAEDVVNHANKIIWTYHMTKAKWSK